MRIELAVPDRASTSEFAAALAGILEGGDVIILVGDLGAGKTTFTQFLGRALDVVGRITSPTFVIAREHAPRGAGPGLVHVDAYRLADPGEFADLDLESDLDSSVTVVEWGRGLAEQLSSDRLEITLLRDFEEGGGEADDGADDPADESRRIVLEAHGESWERRRHALSALAEPTGEAP